MQSGNSLRCRGLVSSATPRSLGSRNRVSAAVKTTYEDSLGRQSAEDMYTSRNPRNAFEPSDVNLGDFESVVTYGGRQDRRDKLDACDRILVLLTDG